MGGSGFGYYFYNNGISPRELRLGNIVWDYRQPTRNRPYQHGEDLVARSDLFEPVEKPDADISFENKKTFSAEFGVEGIAWLGPNWNKSLKTHLTADKLTSVHILSGREDSLVHLVLDSPEAREWLQRNLSAAFTLGPKLKHFFLRPKLWLCTGLITADEGRYEVTYEGGRGGKLEVSDPTGTLPAGVRATAESSPSSSRIWGIASKTIVAAEWTLLYCKNLKRKDPPATPYMVTLTTTLAPDNVKGAPSTVTSITTDLDDITKSEEREVDLYYVSDDSDDDSDTVEEQLEVPVDESSWKELFDPMFPESDTEVEEFENTLQKLGAFREAQKS